jgi:hypothetical protein
MKSAINERLCQEYVKRPKDLRFDSDAPRQHNNRVKSKLKEWLQDNPIDNK